MPLYNYQCSCGEGFEAFRPMESRETAECPKCNRVAEQTVSGTRLAVQKGIGGFYEHISHEGIEIKSRKHLRDELRAREKYAPYVF